MHFKINVINDHTVLIKELFSMAKVKNSEYLVNSVNDQYIIKLCT